jgi:hypothetical protein
MMSRSTTYMVDFGSPTVETDMNLDIGRWRNLAGSSRCFCFPRGYSWVKKMRQRGMRISGWCENSNCWRRNRPRLHGAHIQLEKSKCVVITTLCEECNTNPNLPAFKLKSGRRAPILLGPLCCCYKFSEDDGHLIPVKCRCRGRNLRCYCRRTENIRENDGFIVCTC